MSIITKIEEANNIKMSISEYASTYDGILIHLSDNTTICLLICNQQDCCEDWGYLTHNEDNLNDFVGATINAVNIVDSVYDVQSLNLATMLPQTGESVVDFMNESANLCVFVNVETSSGTLQFVAYNDHNGYYGHEVFVCKRNTDDLEVTETIFKDFI